MNDAAPRPSRGSLLVLGVVVELVLLGAALALGALLGAPPLEGITLNKTAVAIGLLTALPPLFAAWLVMRSSRGPLGALRDDVERKVVPLFVALRVPDMLLLSALAGLAEEALFRGVVQGALSEAVGAWPAVVLAALLFGVVHWVSRRYVVYAAGMGVYLGALLVFSQNLLVPVLAHAVYDLLALLWLSRLGRAAPSASSA